MKNAHFSLPLFGREPRTSRSAGAREAGGARGGPHGGTERHNRRAAPALVRTTPFRPKKKEQTTQALGTFSTYRGAFRRSPPPRSTPTPPQEARAEKPRKSSRAHTRTTPSFCFSPSPIGSNSVVHNALQVKTSKNLTYRKYHTTTSASTPCG